MLLYVHMHHSGAPASMQASLAAEIAESRSCIYVSEAVCGVQHHMMIYVAASAFRLLLSGLYGCTVTGASTSMC